jgi:hypothetical protein
MLSINLKRSAVTLAVMTGVLAAAGPASAIVYTGHAGLGTSAYQHNQTDYDYLTTTHASGISDGTSNTVQFALVAPARGIASDGIGA